MESNDGYYQKLRYEDEDDEEETNGQSNESSECESSLSEEDDDDLGDLHHDLTLWNPTTHDEKRFYHMIMKYKHNVNNIDEDMDMEQVLQVEWSRFIKEYKSEKESHHGVELVAKRFDKLFQSLDW